MLDHAIGRRQVLTGLILPMADRGLLLPNVAVAELIGFQLPQSAPEHSPSWLLGHIVWRHQRLPLIGYEQACGGVTPINPGARIVILHTPGEGSARHVAVLVQGIPRSCRIDSQLSYVDIPLAHFELAAVQVGEQAVRIPNLDALQKLVEPCVSDR